MADTAVNVAYEMLEIAKRQDIELSNLQLQKLVYIAHGYFLGWKGKPLIQETVEAWMYGPVVDEVYQQFKGCGGKKIPVPSDEAMPQGPFSPVEGRAASLPSLAQHVDSMDEDAKKCLTWVIENYGRFNSLELIRITHKPGTPWNQIWNKDGYSGRFAKIPNALIEQHYQNVIKGESWVSGL